MTDTDFSALIEPVARALLGDPNPMGGGGSTPTCLRWGKQGSFAVFLDGPGNWKDFESGEQGGTIALVMREKGSDKDGAVKWLEAEGFIPANERAAGAQPRQDGRSDPATPDAAPEQERQPAGAADDEREVEVESYDYTDAAGVFQYRVSKFHKVHPDGTPIIGKSGNPKKTFRQKSRDASGKITWGLNGREVCLYHWPVLQLAVEEHKTVYLAEGEKDVHTLEAWGLPASTNSGGAQNWKPERFSDTFRGADVVILGDDDEAGRKRCDDVALSLRKIAKRVRVLGSWPGGHKDVTDWKERAGGTSEQLSKLIAQLPDWRPSPPKSTMGAVGLDQLHHPSLKHDFLIDGFLDRQGVAMMPGASGSGKTFLVLEMAMCVATGRPFWGMPCKPGVVLYQAGEGRQGVTKRLDAWMFDRGVEPSAELPFKMLTRRINLFADDKDTDDLIAEGRAWSAYFDQPIRMVVIDTFNKAITGANEISGQDMGKVLARMERISTELDCAVVTPIHKSKEGGMRGHTSLKGDVSNVIEVNELAIRDHNGRIIRTVVLDKNKDGEKGKPLRFVLRQVVLEMTEDGKAITTCVIDKPDGDEEEAARQGKLSLQTFLALKALREAHEDHSEPIPNGVRAGSSIRTAVKYSHWQDRVSKTWAFTAPAEEIEKRKSELQRVMTHYGKVLLAGDYIGKDNDLGIVWLTGKDDRPKRENKPIEKAKPSPMMNKEDLEVPF